MAGLLGKLTAGGSHGILGGQTGLGSLDALGSIGNLGGLVQSLGAGGGSLPLGGNQVTDTISTLVDHVVSALPLDQANSVGDLGSSEAFAPLFNGHTLNQVAQSEPVGLEFGTGKLWLSVLSGPEATQDNSTVAFDLLSFGDSTGSAASGAGATLGPQDATNLDIDILSGPDSSDGTGHIEIGPNLWGGQTPLTLTAAHDPDAPLADPIHIGDNILDPVSDGTVTSGPLGYVNDIFGL